MIRSAQNVRAGRTLAAFALGLSAAFAGCVTDGPIPRPAPRGPAAQPAGIVPSIVDLAATRYARDSDKNGYADEIEATAFLFAPPHDTPITVPGEFGFSLTRLDGRAFAKWVFTPEQSAAVIEKLLPGPGYRFRLRILDHASDVFPSEDLQLRCEFRPTAGGGGRSRAAARSV